MLSFLYITQHFPPLSDVSVQRVLGFVRYLYQEGLLPVMIVPASYWEPFQDRASVAQLPEKLPVFPVPFPEARKIFRTVKGYGTHAQPLSLAQRVHRSLFFPDSKVFFAYLALLLCLKVKKQYHASLVMTHSPPHSTHLVGLYLKKLVPQMRWIADFEDAYSASPHVRAEGKKRWERHRRYEQRIYQQADKVVLATKEMAQAARKIWDRDFEIIPNGFDEEILNGCEAQLLPQPCLVHAGSFFAYRTPFPFLKLCQAYFQSFPESRWKIFFFGRVEMGGRILAAPELKQRVFFFPHQPRKKVLSYIKGATALLVIHGSREEAALHLPAKVFEYMAMRRPILAFSYPGPLVRFIRQHRLGEVIFPDDPQGREKLCSFLARVERGTFSLPSREYLATFSRKARAEELKALILKFMPES